MSWKIFLLRDLVIANIPFPEVVELIGLKSRSGKRFKIKASSNNELIALYSYRDTLYDRLGYLTTFWNELKVMVDKSDANKTAIEFRMPLGRIILNLIIGIAIGSFLTFLSRDLNLLWIAIVLLTLYIGVVVNLNSQFYYFKSDIAKIEEHYIRTN